MDGSVIRNLPDIGVHRTGQGYLFRTFRGFVLPFPQGENKCLDALSLFYIKLSVIHIEGIERNRVVFLIRDVNSILSVCLVIDHPAQALIAVTRIYKQDMRTLFVILAD